MIKPAEADAWAGPFRFGSVHCLPGRHYAAFHALIASSFRRVISFIRASLHFMVISYASFLSKLFTYSITCSRVPMPGPKDLCGQL